MEEVNRLHKVLENAGVKLATVATVATGVSGRAMLAALVACTTDPEVLAEMAKTRMRARLPELRKALDAKFRAHHGFLVSQILAHVDYLDEAITQVDERITGALEPSQGAMTALLTIPGIQRRTAEVVIAEIGTDMTRFPTSRHLASWAGLCPGNNESAGNGSTAEQRKAVLGCGLRWSRRRSARPARTATCRRSTGVSAAAVGTSEPSSRSRTRSWRSSIRSSLAGSSMPTLAATSSNVSSRSRSPGERSASSRSSDTRSSSRTQRQRQRHRCNVSG